jgi:hypothetical protein
MGAACSSSSRGPLGGGPQAVHPVLPTSYFRIKGAALDLLSISVDPFGQPKRFSEGKCVMRPSNQEVWHLYEQRI